MIPSLNPLGESQGGAGDTWGVSGDLLGLAQETPCPRLAPPALKWPDLWA